MDIKSGRYKGGSGGGSGCCRGGSGGIIFKESAINVCALALLSLTRHS